MQAADFFFLIPEQLEDTGDEPQHKDPKKPVTRVHVRVDSKVKGTLRQSLHVSRLPFHPGLPLRPG